MKKNVLLIMLFSILLLLVVMAGCQKKEAAKEEVAEKEAEAVEFSWWYLTGGGGGEDVRIVARNKIIADYEELHPNVKINATALENEAFKQKVQVAIQAGDPPDLFHSWGGGVMIEYAEAGMLRDITDTVKNDLSKRIGMGPLNVYGYNGHYYGAPYDMGAVGMFYNKEIFTKLGVDIPKAWPELLEIVKKAKAAGYVPIALGAGDKWPAHFWWVYLAMRIGGEEAFNAAYSGSGSFASETYIKAGEKLLELAALDPFQEGFLGATYDDQAALMGNGKAAMELMGQWAPATEKANSADGEGLGDKLGWFSFPAVPGGTGKQTDVMGGGNGYVVGKDAPDAAVDFLSFFLQKEYNKVMVDVEGVAPVVKGVTDEIELTQIQKEIINAVSNAGYYQLYYDQFLPPAMGEVIKDAVVALLAGQAGPEKAAQMIQDQWEIE